MAHSISSYSFTNGFRQPAAEPHWEALDSDTPTYELPPSVEVITSPQHNSLGFNVLRTWPTLFNGTASPHGVPDWWKPSETVDVLICGDGVQPRYLETLSTWGLASEVHEEGPLIERTAIYHDGHLVHHGRSHQSDSRYRGLHIITQGQLERIFVRDLMRHRVLVERETTLEEYSVRGGDDNDEAPVRCTLVHQDRDGNPSREIVMTKFLVGSDGASSAIRRQLKIPFDGISTDLYWGIMDCVFDTDYPHAWIFGSVISSQHGGCVIIPRENGYIRLYTQLNLSQTGPIAASRQARESGGQIDVHSITPEEVLEQANRIFAPFTLRFAAPLSWFAVWKISERVARSFSSKDLRVHLVGDAAHVHSVMGAFGLNASILDAANLGWKIGLCVKGKARIDRLLSTYDRERRLHAANIIEVSGKYLRFVCSSHVPTVRLHHVGADLGLEEEGSSGTQRMPVPSAEAISITPTDVDRGGHDQHALEMREVQAVLQEFFTQHGQFLLGVDASYGRSCLNPLSKYHHRAPVRVRNGVRAPNPRVCLDADHTGYLYDRLPGDGRFHLVVFGSNLRGPVREQLVNFSRALLSDEGFYRRLGGHETFNLVLVAKGVPWEVESRLSQDHALHALYQTATMLFDDRAPDDDAHSTWGVDHQTGAVVVVRPDLWVGISLFPQDVDHLREYFEHFWAPCTWE
ncbi:hypothetical protein ASPCADRAFT_517848 [Aspergillus carbonarius ITEM 5010]|uniref:FAD-binding domain-containing protein n=1 Tax=Aspergillus carbonarius (strain ITEM 5010) TaxID=602072 RepID=A0A1R3RD97_ASPC5|nr:hypothetical protein ASPCADRAFT_517848 [Aspergillus carbonarius ITEM 5010]